jgi:hypothetical protein
MMKNTFVQFGRTKIIYIRENFTKSSNQSGKFNNQRPLLILIAQTKMFAILFLMNTINRKQDEQKN